MPRVAIATDTWAGDEEPLFIRTDHRALTTWKSLTLAQSVIPGSRQSRMDQQENKSRQTGSTKMMTEAQDQTATIIPVSLGQKLHQGFQDFF